MNEEQLKQAMDLYADFQNKKESLNSEKQKILDEIIPEEIRAKLEDAEEEFKDKEEMISLQETNARKILDKMLEQYAQSQILTDSPIKLQSTLASVSIKKGDIIWDAKSLDAYVIAGHTEILSFRKEEKPKIRVMRNKI